jgi:preprotein translocase subunit SecB
MSQPEKEFAIQRLYLKDLSLETPMGPEVFKKQWKPKVHLDVNTKNNALEKEIYEVVLTLTITAKIEDGDKTGFLVEVHQAGIFTCKGIEGDELRHVLSTVAPNVLFPYAREAVDSVVTKASFPPLMLAPINFDALYQQALQEQEGQEATH